MAEELKFKYVNQKYRCMIYSLRLILDVLFEFYTIIKEMIVLILMAKYISFTKTPLLIIVSGVVIDDWSTINKDMLVERNKKYYIDIIKGTNNLRQKKIEKRTPNMREKRYHICPGWWYSKWRNTPSNSYYNYIWFIFC